VGGSLGSASTTSTIKRRCAVARSVFVCVVCSAVVCVCACDMLIFLQDGRHLATIRDQLVALRASARVDRRGIRSLAVPTHQEREVTHAQRA